MRAALTIAGVLLCTGVLAGCSAAAPSTSTNSDRKTSSDGPWAELFETTYTQATSDDERAALADGTIDAEEYAFFQSAILDCLEGLGVEGNFNADGSLDYTAPPGASREAIRDCNADNGIRVLVLHDSILRNPTHRDESEIMLECLQRTEVVGTAYTRADLDAGVDLDELAADPDFAGCAADPLGYGAD